MNKNLLSENMLRFGTKNLSESQKRNLVLESVMETIKEHGLTNEVKRRLNEGKTVEETVDNLWDAFSSFGSSDIDTVVNELLSLKPAQYNEASNLMYKKYGMAIMPAIAKYCPGDEVTKPSSRGGLTILDAMMRLWYPSAFKQATNNGTTGSGDGTAYFNAGLSNKDPYKTIVTSRTGWQKTKGQWTGSKELSSGGYQ